MVAAPIPKTVGRYQILERVAVGGMAELYKATLHGQEGFAKVVAIKKILPHLAADRAFLEMFKDEARLTAQLDHRHIVQVFELGMDADLPYIAMQFVDGLDVLGLLNRCVRAQIPLPAALATMIVRDVVDALDYAHHAVDSAGRPMVVIHRDISPGNVLVSRRGDVKLTDFGIAHAAQRHHHTEAGTLKGKYGYMSPEQVLGAEIDPRSDLFSVGILLAEMVMKRRLFIAPSDLDVLLMVRDVKLDRLHKYADAFPPALLQIVLKALERRPEDRFQNAAELREALDEWLRGESPCGPRDLAALIEQVDRRLPPDPPGTPPTTVDREGLAAALVGSDEARLAPEASRAARALPPPPPRPRQVVQPGAPATVIVDEASSGVITIEDAEPQSRPIAVPSLVREVGDLKEVPVMRLLHRLAKGHATGLLVLEGRAGTLKEVYLAGGHPEFVNSNVERERLGTFLVAEGALTAEDLARALGQLPPSGGSLAKILVELRLIHPLDVTSLLTKQVAAKLVEACGWAKGRSTWTAGHPNPWSGTPSLHLDAFRILGLGALALGAPLLEAWQQAHARAFVVGEPATAADLAVFGLGEALPRAHGLLDGRTRLAELGARVRSADARLNLLRLTYLLVHADLARLS